jgi:hypothetical protein
LVQFTLVGGVPATDSLGDLAVHVPDRARHAFATERTLVIAKLERLACSRRPSRGDGSAAERA